MSDMVLILRERYGELIGNIEFGCVKAAGRTQKCPHSISILHFMEFSGNDVSAIFLCL